MILLILYMFAFVKSQASPNPIVGARQIAGEKQDNLRKRAEAGDQLETSNEGTDRPQLGTGSILWSYSRTKRPAGNMAGFVPALCAPA
jgi:hypothetical protein